MSMQSGNSPDRERASTSKHSRRPSGWSQTRWRQTTFSAASGFVRTWSLPLQKLRFRIADNEDIPERLSKVRFCRHIGRIQIHPANGNGQDTDDKPVHRRTSQEIPDRCEDSLSPLSGAAGWSCHQILLVGVTCVKWIPPFVFCCCSYVLPSPE